MKLFKRIAVVLLAVMLAVPAAFFNAADVKAEASPSKTDIKKCTITVINKTLTYTGKAQRPSVKVVYNGKTLKKGTDYTISYPKRFVMTDGSGHVCDGPINVSKHYVTIQVTGIGKFTGKWTSSKFVFTITKAAQKLTTYASGKKASSKSYKASTIKKGAKSFTLKVTGSKGTLSFKSSTKKVTVKKLKGGKSVKVTVKKGYKGTAKITIKAKATKNYSGKTKYFYVKVK